jgi:hypothetical protein
MIGNVNWLKPPQGKDSGIGAVPVCPFHRSEVIFA